MLLIWGLLIILYLQLSRKHIAFCELMESGDLHISVCLVLNLMLLHQLYVVTITI